jgi:hypothetical protein
MSTAKIGNLEIQIEELVRGHIAELRAYAAAAVERAFARAVARGGKTGRATAPAARASGKRRPPQEMTALAERLYAVVCTHPGAAMTTLASELSTSPRELNRPALLLKRAGRVRTVGQRAGTRYFPMVAKTGGARS